MSGPLRIDLAGGVYHITARGKQQSAIYVDDVDRRGWLRLLATVCKRHGWTVHAWCLMNDHFHLVVETRDDGIASGMHELNAVYNERFNRRHRRSGALFQGRYTGIMVEKQAFLLPLARHVVRNPVRAGYVREAGDWPWSSFRATASQAPSPAWLEKHWLLSQFAGARRADRVAAYRGYVRDGAREPSIWHALKQPYFLGSDTFIENLLTDLFKPRSRRLAEIPRRERGPSLSTFSDMPDRNVGMARAHLTGGYSAQTIADHFGVGRSTVSRAVQRITAGAA